MMLTNYPQSLEVNAKTGFEIWIYVSMKYCFIILRLMLNEDIIMLSQKQGNDECNMILKFKFNKLIKTNTIRKMIFKWFKWPVIIPLCRILTGKHHSFVRLHYNLRYNLFLLQIKCHVSNFKLGTSLIINTDFGQIQKKLEARFFTVNKLKVSKYLYIFNVKLTQKKRSQLK